VLDIADITSRSGQFLQRLKEEIINEDWDLEAVMVKEEPTDYVGQPLHIRRKLDLFFTNQQKPELSVYGEYGDNILIREGVEKPFSDGTFNKFRQGRLGRSLEYLFSGTDIIPLDFHDWSHSIEVPLRRSVGTIFTEDIQL